jgi:hypothetical protein
MMITRLTDLRQAVQYETAKVVTKKSEGEAGWIVEIQHLITSYQTLTLRSQIKEN